MISMGGTSGQYGYFTPGSPGGASPHPGIGSSMNYVQGMQNESRTQAFGTGAQEAKGTPSSGGGGGMLGKIFGKGGGSAEAGGAEAGAGAAEGIGAEAATVAEVV